ncbi:ATP-binding protein [Herbaspirillum autotrophicum]|uniref:ATP-binding protein n=1 Tax=Herbaspirillum autotrophicum TaxID=180195 RepID=UPI0009FA5263|nr:ATP-binding protein [Herbaspirillum autotrophicum]
MEQINIPFNTQENSSKKNEDDVEKEKSLISQILLHPLMTGQVLLPTKPAKELFSVVWRAVLLRETGLCLSASSGAGKTSALEMIEEMIRQKLPTLPIFRHETHNQQIPSIRAFFKHFLVTVGHSELKGETFDLRQRLVNSLVDEARISGQNVVLMLIDEAHAMAVSDFNFLKDVYNDLGKEGVQLVTVLMGQEPDLSILIKKIRSEGRLDLIGRFAMRILPFRAYKTIDDLKLILSGIDSTEHPQGSGITWTGFFFPYAYAEGFRLEDQAQNFLDAIQTEMPKSIVSKIQIPARQTFLAIRTFVMDNAAINKPRRIHADAWRKAVAYAKLQDAILLIRGRGQAGDLTVEI